MSDRHAPQTAELLDLLHPTAEETVLAAMLRDSYTATQLAQDLLPADFHDPRRAVLFEAACAVLRGVEPMDTPTVAAECRRIIRERSLRLTITPEWIDSHTGDVQRAAAYGATLKKLSWLRNVGDFALWLAAELADRPNPDDLFSAAQERWQLLAPAKKQANPFVYGWETVEPYLAELAQRSRRLEAGDEKRLTWPWASWRTLVRPLRAGMVGMLAAPDGVGKSTYLEQIAEHAASVGLNTVLVHLEDELQVKKDRRMSRHALVDNAHIEDGQLTADEWRRIEAANQRIAVWGGRLHYLHAPGWTMEEICRELRARAGEGVVDVIILDYIDKCRASRGQLRLYGSDSWQRQADDMEQFKSLCEQLGVAGMTATQGNKTMLDDGRKTRKNIAGSGQKSHKSQLVAILTRETLTSAMYDNNGELVADAGEPSPIAHIRIDKQNRGKVCEFEQYFVGQFFTVRDLR